MTIRAAMDLVPLAYTLTGIGVYVQQLVAAINSESTDIQLGFTSHCEIPIPALMRKLFRRNLDAEEVKRVSFDLKLGCAPFGPMQRFAPKVLNCDGFDLYHITSTVPHYQRYTVPTVVTVYDLADLRTDRNTTRYAALLSAIRNANRVLCISEATRRDVIELVGIAESRTVVTPLAPRPIFRPPENEQQRMECRDELNRGVPYLLAVSTIEPRKNYVRMLQAFARVRERGHQFDFLIAGAKRTAWPEVAQTIEQHGLQSCVRVLGWVDNQRLLKLMWGSMGLAYASIYEGFGLPIAEAMACGTPIITSNTGSIPEVVGSTFPLVDPLSVECIADRMEQVVGANVDVINRATLLERASEFSWSRTACTTIDAYRSVIDG